MVYFTLSANTIVSGQLIFIFSATLLERRSGNWNFFDLGRTFFLHYSIFRPILDLPSLPLLFWWKFCTFFWSQYQQLKRNPKIMVWVVLWLFVARKGNMALNEEKQSNLFVLRRWGYAAWHRSYLALYRPHYYHLKWHFSGTQGSTIPWTSLFWSEMGIEGNL